MFVETKKREDLGKCAFSINGVWFEDLIDGYITTSVSGREGVVRKLNEENGKYISSELEPRHLKINFAITAVSELNLLEKLDELNKLLNLEKSEVIFNGEPDKCYYGIPSMADIPMSAINNVDDINYVGSGSYEIVCHDPYKYAIEKKVYRTEGDSITVFNEGDAPVYPVIEYNTSYTPTPETPNYIHIDSHFDDMYFEYPYEEGTTNYVAGYLESYTYTMAIGDSDSASVRLGLSAVPESVGTRPRSYKEGDLFFHDYTNTGVNGWDNKIINYACPLYNAIYDEAADSDIIESELDDAFNINRDENAKYLNSYTKIYFHNYPKSPPTTSTYLFDGSIFHTGKYFSNIELIKFNHDGETGHGRDLYTFYEYVPLEPEKGYYVELLHSFYYRKSNVTLGQWYMQFRWSVVDDYGYDDAANLELLHLRYRDGEDEITIVPSTNVIGRPVQHPESYITVQFQFKIKGVPKETEYKKFGTLLRIDVSTISNNTIYDTLEIGMPWESCRIEPYAGQSYIPFDVPAIYDLYRKKPVPYIGLILEKTKRICYSCLSFGVACKFTETDHVELFDDQQHTYLISNGNIRIDNQTICSDAFRIEVLDFSISSEAGSVPLVTPKITNSDEHFYVNYYKSLSFIPSAKNNNKYFFDVNTQKTYIDIIPNGPRVYVYDTSGTSMIISTVNNNENRFIEKEQTHSILNFDIQKDDIICIKKNLNFVEANKHILTSNLIGLNIDNSFDIIDVSGFTTSPILANRYGLSSVATGNWGKSHARYGTISISYDLSITIGRPMYYRDVNNRIMLELKNFTVTLATSNSVPTSGGTSGSKDTHQVKIELTVNGHKLSSYISITVTYHTSQTTTVTLTDFDINDCSIIDSTWRSSHRNIYFPISDMDGVLNAIPVTVKVTDENVTTTNSNCEIFTYDSNDRFYSTSNPSYITKPMYQYELMNHGIWRQKGIGLIRGGSWLNTLQNDIINTIDFDGTSLVQKHKMYTDITKKINGDSTRYNVHTKIIITPPSSEITVTSNLWLHNNIGFIIDDRFFGFIIYSSHYTTRTSSTIELDGIYADPKSETKYTTNIIDTITIQNADGYEYALIPVILDVNLDFIIYNDYIHVSYDIAMASDSVTIDGSKIISNTFWRNDAPITSNIKGSTQLPIQYKSAHKISYFSSILSGPDSYFDLFNWNMLISSLALTEMADNDTSDFDSSRYIFDFDDLEFKTNEQVSINKNADTYNDYDKSVLNTGMNNISVVCDNPKVTNPIITVKFREKFL